MVLYISQGNVTSGMGFAGSLDSQGAGALVYTVVDTENRL